MRHRRGVGFRFGPVLLDIGFHRLRDGAVVGRIGPRQLCARLVAANGGGKALGRRIGDRLVAALPVRTEARAEVRTKARVDAAVGTFAGQRPVCARILGTTARPASATRAAARPAAGFLAVAAGDVRAGTVVGVGSGVGRNIGDRLVKRGVGAAGPAVLAMLAVLPILAAATTPATPPAALGTVGVVAFALALGPILAPFVPPFLPPLATAAFAPAVVLGPRVGGGRVILGLVLVLDAGVQILVVDLRHQAGAGRHDVRRRFGHVPGRGLELLHREVGRDQRRVRLDPHGHAVARLDHADMLALLVHQEVGDRDGRAHQHLAGALAGAFFLDRAQDGQRHAVVRPDQAGAVAMRAGLGGRFQHPRAQPLARHLQQAEARDAADLDPRPIGLEPVLEAFLDARVVLALVHVDEVDDDQPGQVAKAQLARDLVRGLAVRLVGGVLDGPFLGRPARVHVDRDQRLGHADDDVAARFQLHDRVEHPREVAFDLVAREQRHRVVVQLHVLGVGRHDHLHEVLGGAETALALDQNLVDVLAVKVADGPLDEVAFLVDRRGRGGLEGQLADLFPQPHQVFVVALDLGPGALAAGGADDETRALRHLKLGRDVLQLLAVGGVGDLAGNPAAPRGVRHQHAVAARERQIGGQRRALIAALFLDDLDQHDLPDLDDFLDLVAARARLLGGADFLGHVLVGDRLDGLVAVGRGLVLRGIGVLHVVAGPGFAGRVIAAVFACVVSRRLIAAIRVRAAFRVIAGRFRLILGRLILGRHRVARTRLGRARTAALAALPCVLLGLGGLGGLALFLDQGAAVGGGDLVIVGVDFREGQEAVAVAAVFDKGGLQRRFDPRHLRQVDVAGKLALVQRFKVELLDLGSVHDDHAGFFRMGCVDQHLVCHETFFRAAGPARLSAGKGTGCGLMRTRAALQSR